MSTASPTSFSSRRPSLSLHAPLHGWLPEASIVEQCAVAGWDQREAKHAAVSEGWLEEGEWHDRHMRLPERRTIRRVPGDDLRNRRPANRPVVTGHHSIAQRLADEGCRAQIRHLAADVFQDQPAAREDASRRLVNLRRCRRQIFALVRSASGIEFPLQLGEPPPMDATTRAGTCRDGNA